MIIYNVTLNVDDSIREEWLEWMRKIHLPEMLQTGLFVEYKFLRLIDDTDEDTTGSTYAVQFFMNDVKDFLDYTENHAAALRKKTMDKYGEKILSFRTLLEVLE